MGKADWVKIAFAVAATCLQYLLGGWDQALITLIVFIVLDYLTGVLAAWCSRTLNSYVGLKGIAKKVLMLVLVGVAHQVDLLTGSTGIIRLAVLWFLIANEGLSILENVAALSVPIPDVLRKALEVLKEKK